MYQDLKCKSLNNVEQRILFFRQWQSNVLGESNNSKEAQQV